MCVPCALGLPNESWTRCCGKNPGAGCWEGGGGSASRPSTRETGLRNKVITIQERSGKRARPRARFPFVSFLGRNQLPFCSSVYSAPPLARSLTACWPRNSSSPSLSPPPPFFGVFHPLPTRTKAGTFWPRGGLIALSRVRLSRAAFSEVSIDLCFQYRFAFPRVPAPARARLFLPSVRPSLCSRRPVALT